MPERRRITATMMPRPTTTSAAATTSTKNTTTWPPTSLSIFEKGVCRRHRIRIEKDENLSGDDVREGLTAVISVKLAEPQFEGQTKGKLGNTEAKTFVQKMVNDHLGAWFEANPAEGKQIARKSVDAAAVRMAARKARSWRGLVR